MDGSRWLLLHGARAALTCGLLFAGCDSSGNLATTNDAVEKDDDEARDTSPEQRQGTAPKAPDAARSRAGDAGSDPGRSSSDAGGRSSGKNASASDAAMVKAGAELPCEIAKIVESRCGLCHGAEPAFGAPMALTSAAQFQAYSSDKGQGSAEVVKTRVNATSGRMPPASSEPLSERELAALNTWLDLGAPAGDQRCSGAPEGAGKDAGPSDPAEIDTKDLECHKFLAHAPGDKTTKFKVGAAKDAFYSMAFKAPWQGAGYAQVIRPVVDNMNVLHHWLLYEEPGTDGAVEPSIGQHGEGNMIAGWAPGGPSYDFRKFGDVALELPGSSYVLEMHYNSSDANALDASGVEVCMTKNKPANIAGNSWIGYDNWLLAGDLGGPRTEWTGTCKHTSREPIHVLYVTPHMHLKGKHMKSVITDSAGQSRVLHDKVFDFAYQTSYEKAETLLPGETVTTTCTYSEPKSFGQATNEEMCYLFVYSYPKGALKDDGAWGAFAHGEGTCLGQ